MRQRDHEAHSARFDVGLLQRPVQKETIELFFLGKLSERRYFRRREKAVGDAEKLAAPLPVFDVDADLPLARDDTRDEAVRVRELNFNERALWGSAISGRP